MPRDIPNLLALAEERVARSEVHLQKQRAIVATLRRLGRDTIDAEAILSEFARAQARFIDARDQLRDELEQIATR